MRPTRRSLLLAAVQGAVGWAARPGAASAAGAGRLGGIAAARGLLYGTKASIYSTTIAGDPQYADLLARECGLFVCSRAHWDDVAPIRRDTEFAEIESEYAWAHAHGMPFRGHCLVWHERVPAWFGQLESRSEAVRALEDHVTATCQHFAGRMQSWDVVNEAIKPSDGRPDGLRQSVFLDKIGPEFLDIAFQHARSADPKALLVYNEYGVELDIPDNRERRQALLGLLDRFRKRGTPIDAVGLQSHLATGSIASFDEKVFGDFLGELASRGVKIMLTELDVVDRSAPADIARRDAEVAAVYRRYLEAALANRAVSAVITWGLTDRYTWIGLPDYPISVRSDGLPPRPLPFDSDCRPKPAYVALAEALNGAPAR
jgi:endo-1,4-beta-xylanase